jgi:hypothetical protein
MYIDQKVVCTIVYKYCELPRVDWRMLCDQGSLLPSCNWDVTASDKNEHESREEATSHRSGSFVDFAYPLSPPSPFTATPYASIFSSLLEHPSVAVYIWGMMSSA